MSASDARPAAGPVFTRGPLSDLLVALIRARHAEVRVLDRGAYLRVLVPGQCRLLRAEVEERLGRAFHLPSDLEEIMPSWTGSLTIGADEVVWGSQREERREDQR